jgi:hypothetical protein
MSNAVDIAKGDDELARLTQLEEFAATITNLVASARNDLNDAQRALMELEQAVRLRRIAVLEKFEAEEKRV